MRYVRRGKQTRTFRGFIHAFALRLIAVPALLLLAAPGVPAAPAADGWDMLWRNRNGEARAAFRAALKQNPADLKALRGLGLLNLQEDAEVAAMQAWRPLYRMAPAHWSATAYWPRMVELAEETGRWGVLEAAARDVLGSPKAPPELRASARLALADIAFRAGRESAAEAQWAALGYVRRWQVIGPFDNSSRSGFDKRFPPEREVDFTKSYPGVDALPRRWRRLALVTRNGQCAVASSLGDDSDGVFYAATALFSPHDQKAVLRLDPTGASKVLVNGRRVLSDPIYRQRQALVADPLRAAVMLCDGWNLILVKLADDESTEAAFALRVTATSGEDLKGIRADPAVLGDGTLTIDDRAAPPSASTTSVETATVALLREQARGGEIEAAAALADHLYRARDYEAAAGVVREALARAPGAGWLHWQLGRILEEDQQVDEARAERDRARKQNPRIIAAELHYLEDGKSALHTAERRRRLQALLKVNPQSAAVHLALAELHEEAGLSAEALRAARAAEASRTGPDDARILSRFYRLHDRGAEAERVLERARRAYPNSEALLLTRIHRLTAKRKNTAELAHYQRLTQINPAEPIYRLRLAVLYRSTKDLNKAAQQLRVARGQRPQDASVCTSLADVLREMGRPKEAIALYRVAVRLAPSEFEPREKLRLLLGEPPVVDLVPATPAAPILAKTPTAADLPGVSAVVLLDEGREVVYPDCTAVTYSRYIVKVFDAAGVQRYQEHPLAVTSACTSATVESARIIKPDGKVQHVDAGGLGESVSFPSLAPGDVIDIAYRMEEHRHGALARQFWAQWVFDEPNVPVKLSRYVLIAPPDLKLQVQAHGDLPGPAVRGVKGWRVREWRVTDLPARKQELMSVPWEECALWLDISTVPSWRHIVEWYRDLSETLCLPDATIRRKAEALTRNARTEEEKIRAIVAFVAREIRYQTVPFRMSAYVPTEGRKVLADGYGDCKDKAALLTALLAAVGIRSDIALLNPRSDGIAPPLPSPRFSHAVSRVETSRGPLWVDATADQLAFGDLPTQCQQVPALVIRDDTTELTVTPALPCERNRTLASHTAVLGADGRLTGNVALSVSGERASWGRSGLQQFPEAQRDEALRALAAVMLAGVRYERGSVEHLADPDRPLTFRFSYQAEGYSTAAGNLVLVRLPWQVEQRGVMALLAAGPSRQYDLDVAAVRSHFSTSVRLELPAGHAPQELPAPVEWESPWASCRITYRMEGNVLHAESDVRITAMRVPGAEAPEFIAFLSAIDQALRKQIVLRKS